MNLGLEAPICNYINLTAAIFGVKPEIIASKINVKLPVKHPPRPCLSCGEPITTRHAFYCENCRFIPVACAICNKITYVRRARLFYKDDRRRPRFCSWHCRGVSSGNTYGFKVQLEKRVRSSPTPDRKRQTEKKCVSEKNKYK